MNRWSLRESYPVPQPPSPDEVRDPRATYEGRTRVKVKLADGKERTIQHMMMTTFWHPDGTPMSAQQFMELLFGKIPNFFKDEAELRTIWSAPDTRRKLLQGLAEKGFGHDQLAEMQKILDAVADLGGRPESISEAFAGFQQYLYQEAIAA